VLAVPVIALSFVANLRIDLLVLGYGHLVCEPGVTPQLFHGCVADSAQHLAVSTIEQNERKLITNYKSKLSLIRIRIKNPEFAMFSEFSSKKSGSGTEKTVT